MTANFFHKVISKLIDKEFKRQEYSNQAMFNSKKSFYPCITVSRESGSGGRLIAALVAKKLKIKFYDKQFVNLISKSSKKRKEVVLSLDERSKGVVEGIIDSLTSSKNKLSASHYFKHLCQIILSLSEKNSAVILGRGSNFIIPPRRALNVRIIAPFKVRVANAIKYEKKSLNQAKKHIDHTYNERKDFVKRYFLKDISNANYYDLVINTEFTSLEQAVDIIAKAFKDRFA
ncbi:AAA family ATPase [Patescibacteria group bacterium]